MIPATNFFALLRLPERFDIDLALLEEHYRRLQRQVHPDNYVSADPVTRCQADLMASQINEAYLVLKNPVNRAKHLLALQGIVLENEPDYVPPVFLAQQMDWQEALEEAQDREEIQSILSEIQSKKSAALLRLETLFRESAHSETVILTLQIIQYLDRLLLNASVL